MSDLRTWTPDDLHQLAADTARQIIRGHRHRQPCPCTRCTRVRRRRTTVQKLAAIRTTQERP